MEIKQKLKIKGNNVPVFIEGEEVGVIVTQTFDMPDEFEPYHVFQIDHMKDKLIEKHIEVITEEYNE